MNWQAVRHRVKGALLALPAALWVILAGLLGLLAVLAGVKRRAGQEGATDEALRGAKDRAARIREDAARGNDAGVQQALGDAVETARKRRR